MSAATRLTIDIWSDVMCPWCIIGYKQLQRALDELHGEIEAEVRWRPFELNPDIPPEGEDLARHLLRKFGQKPSGDGLEQIVRVADRAGYDMRYRGPRDENGQEPPRRMWNTLKAHKLLHWALERHGAGAQTRLKLALFDAHFQERRNISDNETLFAIADEVGLDMDGAGERCRTTVCPHTSESRNAPRSGKVSPAYR